MSWLVKCLMVKINLIEFDIRNFRKTSHTSSAEGMISVCLFREGCRLRPTFLAEECLSLILTMTQNAISKWFTVQTKVYCTQMKTICNASEKWRNSIF